VNPTNRKILSDILDISQSIRKQRRSAPARSTVWRSRNRREVCERASTEEDCFLDWRE